MAKRATPKAKDAPVVILCGGEGTRLRELTDLIPKPLVQVAGRPLLWHIMRHYSNHGYRRFVLALGYKADAIKEYFVQNTWRTNDIRVDLRKGRVETLGAEEAPDWEITCVDTGLKTNTGGRVKRLAKHLEGGRFLLTYGDGLSDVPIDRLVKFHETKGKVATLTGVTPFSNFGELRFTRDSILTDFHEKPLLRSRINGGYFVFEPAMLDLLGPDDVLEQAPLRKLAEKREMAIYQHNGFWRCVDTYKDWQAMEALAATGGLAWLDRK